MFKDDDNYYIIQELCNGVNLKELVNGYCISFPPIVVQKIMA